MVLATIDCSSGQYLLRVTYTFALNLHPDAKGLEIFRHFSGYLLMCVYGWQLDI